MTFLAFSESLRFLPVAASISIATDVRNQMFVIGFKATYSHDWNSSYPVPLLHHATEVSYTVEKSD